MKRCVVIGAAQIHNYEKVKTYLCPETDFYIFCDGGLYHQKELNVTPDFICGDFDSYTDAEFQNQTLKNFPQIKTQILPREKDDTDTFFAVKDAVSKGYENFLLLGVSGGRLDHTLANLSILQFLFKNKKKALLVDDFSEIEIVGKTPVQIPQEFKFFSLLNISGIAEEIDITGAKYPLQKGKIDVTYQYAVSNEVLQGTSATVSVGKGSLLLIKDF